MIKVSGLNKYYNKGKANELHVINDTSITFDDTGLVCILGESGSGKTTLMNTISGLDNFASGTIEVDDKVITKYGSAEQEYVRNEKFGYIFQNYYLLSDRTVEYNIKLALSLYDISEEEKDARVDYVLKAVEMSRYKKRPVSQLSGGQQQRIAIARALAKTPRVIFADEPTGNLDETNTLRTMSILKKLSKDCLVVVVTHERSIADFFADRIIWISDGKIEKEMMKQSQGSYEYVDDTNIYLQEFDKKEFASEDIKIETYKENKEGEQVEPLEIKFIYEKGKVYIYSENSANIEFITNSSEKKVIDSKRPTVEMDDIENMEYTLEKIESTKKPKMSFREICSLALSNIKTAGKKQIFLALALIAMSVLIVLTVQDVMGSLSVNKQEVLWEDSNYIQVTMDKNAMIDNATLKENMLKVMNALVDSGKGTICIKPIVYMSYQYDGFWQLESVASDIKFYSIVPLDMLSEKDLIYGEMPKERNEVVVDKWILENFINNGSEFSNVITDIKHFLGKTLIASSSNVVTELKIVGIANTENVSIYVDKITTLGLSSWSASMLTASELKEMYPDKYKNLKLEEGKVLVPESEFERYREDYYKLKFRNFYTIYKGEWPRGWRQNNYEQKFAEEEEYVGMTYDEMVAYIESGEIPELTYTFKFGPTYKIAGTFEDIDGVDVIISDAQYQSLVNEIAAYNKTFYIYTKDKAEVMDFLNNSIVKRFGSKVSFDIVDLEKEQLAKYEKEREVKFSGTMVVTLTIFVISIIILYFMMKTNAIKRMTDISVYRLLGISKGTIVGIFAIENIVITTFTSVLGALATIGVMRFVSSIPALGITFVFPWYAFVGTIIFFYVVNTFVGVQPIKKILKLPPAQLAAKYDI